MKVQWPLLVRRVHKWLALFVGVQVVIWVASGMYMVAVHIDYIHGDHLVRRPAARLEALDQLVAPAAAIAADPEVRVVRLQRLLDQPVWRVEANHTSYLVDARSGRRLPPLTEQQVRRVADRIYTGDPVVTSVQLVTASPLEMQGRKPPYWRVEYKGWNQPTLYISPRTGDLIGRRHNLWRVFDFVWMMHIMDYEERTDVNNPLLRIATWSAVLMALAGAWLLFWAFPRRKKAI